MKDIKVDKHLKDEQYYIELIDKLIELRLIGQLTEEEYTAIRTLLLKQISLLKERIKKPEPGVQDWRTVAEVAFDFATHAHKVFKEGDTKTKRAMVMALGQNYTLKDRELNLEFNPLLQPIRIYAENNNK